MTELSLPRGPLAYEGFSEDLEEQVAACLRPFEPAQINKKPQSGNQPGLDYVGHAHVTERLLKVDPAWNWEPAAWEDGRPKMAFDGRYASMWIRLTIGGVTRLGVGTAEFRKERWVGPDGSKRKEEYPNQEYEKELVSDALRNAAMRFGVALELWAKGGLEGEGGAIGDGGQTDQQEAGGQQQQQKKTAPPARSAAPARPGPKPSAARPPAASKPATRPDAGAQSSGDLDSLLVSLPKVFSGVPASERKKAMAALQENPSQLDSGPVPLWPLVTKGAKKPNGDPLTDEELMIVASDTYDAVTTFVAESKLKGQLGAE